jgi:MFS family permease
MEAAVKKYARADSCFRGTAIVGNLTSKLLVLFIPGFGDHALAMAVGLQFLIAAALELPTGYIGDRFGWRSAVKVGLLLKPLTTVCLMLAAASAYYSQPILAWFFIASEAIIDAIASALLSGNIQAGALEWHKRHGGSGNLFLESQKYSFWLRFLIPLSAGVIGLAVFLLTRNNIYVVAAIISSLFILRFKVYSEILNVVDEPKEALGHSHPKHFFEGLVHLRESLMYLVFSSFTAYTVTMYFIGGFSKQITQMFAALNGNALVGFSVMFFLVFVLQIINKQVHPYLNSRNLSPNKKVCVLLLVIGLAAVQLILFKYQGSLVLLAMAIILSLFMTSLAQALIVMSQAEIHKSRFKGNSSALISVGEMGATGLLGMLSFFLALMKSESINLIYLSVIVFLGLVVFLQRSKPA